MPEIWVCCWCHEYLPYKHIAAQDYEYCPLCMGSFSFIKPYMLDMGAYI